MTVKWSGNLECFVLYLLPMKEAPGTIRVFQIHSDREFELVFDLRARILQEEMGVPEDFDLDGNDHIANHYLAFVDNQPVGTARWRVTLGRKVKLERFAVLPEFRGKGIGRKLLDTIITDTPVGQEVFLEAHEEVVPFYEKNGFIRDGSSYDVSGILHQRMIFLSP